jgi:hypothetical protein
VRRLAPILVAVLIASCGSRPGVAVSVDGQSIPTVLASTTEGTACSTAHGDAFPQNVPLTILHLPRPAFHFDAGKGTTEIRGWIYDLDSPSQSGGPNEEFTLSGSSGTYEPRIVQAARTYSVTVNVHWSFVITQGEETHLFRLRIEAP